jgi:hypothetical protein
VQVKSARGEEYDAFYDLRTPAGVQQAASAPPLESGDVVIAEAETASTVYFTGLLAGGGPVAFTAGDPVSFLQAMAMSGGRDPITDPNFGLLRRKLDTGEVVEVELKLKDLEEGREPDFMMAAGDLVTVPHTWRTRLWEFVNQSVRFSAGASTSVNYDPLTQDRFDRQLDQTVNRNGGNFAAPSLVGLPNFFSPAFPSAPSPP